MGPKPESMPQGAGEVVFLLGGTLTVSQGQTTWGPFPDRPGSGQVVVGTTYNWTGAGLWQVTLDGQGGSSEAAPAAGDADGKDGKEQGSVS